MRQSRPLSRRSFESLESRQFLAADALNAVPQSLLVDMNGDHKADQISIVRSSTANTGVNTGGVILMISLGRGDGTFRRSDTVRFGYNTAVVVAAGDLDGDGSADVAVGGTNPLSMTPSNNGTLVLTFFGDGHGRFRRPNFATVEPAPHATFFPEVNAPSALVVSDLDGSGYGDVALLGKVTLPSSNTPNSNTPSAAANTTPGAVVRWDTTLATFAPVPPTLVPLTFIDGPDRMFAGDLDGNGRTDLVATRSAPLPPSPLAVVRPDLGTIAFPTSRNAVVRQGMNPLYVGFNQYPSPAANTVPARMTLGLAEVDFTPGLELIGREGDATIRYSIYGNTGFKPAITANSWGLPANAKLRGVQLGDITGDGLADLLADSSAGLLLGVNISYFVDSDRATFSWRRVLSSNVTSILDATGPAKTTYGELA